MFSIRGKLIVYALTAAAVLIVLLALVSGSAAWARAAVTVLSLGAVGLALLLVYSIDSGVDRLVAATRRIGAGKYDDPVPGRGSDELGVLATEIDRMRVVLREKVRLLEELNRNLERKVGARTSELETAKDRLALIHDVATKVNSSLDFDDIFQATVSGTRRLVDFDQASVARRIDPETTVVFAISGPSPDLERGKKTPLSGSRIGEVLKSRRPVVFDRPRGDSREDTLLMSASAREVVLPLTVGEEVIGTFNLGSRRPDAFSRSDLEVLEQIAAALSVALLQADTVEKLKELSDLKSEFVSKVSHELRTPLTSILGGVDNLLDGIAGPLEDKFRSYLVRIKENGKRLLGLINDLLDLARIEAGEEELQVARFSLLALVTEVVETVRPLADERTVAVRSLPGPDLAISADRDKIARVLLNLLHNGIKFTQPGGQVEVSFASRANGWAEVTVRDTGVGIPPSEMGRIFDKFHQVKRSGDRTIHGSGLGLPISRELVHMHGGELSVTSTPGHGSAFTIILPPVPGERLKQVG